MLELSERTKLYFMSSKKNTEIIDLFLKISHFIRFFNPTFQKKYRNKLERLPLHSFAIGKLSLVETNHVEYCK